MLFGPRGAAPLIDSYEKQAVKNWLQEHLNDPDYQVVRWYEPIETRGAKVWMRSRGFDSLHWDDNYWDELDFSGAAIRLKYREKSALGGAKILRDQTFLIKAGKVDSVRSSENFRYPGETVKQMWQRVED